MPRDRGFLFGALVVAVVVVANITLAVVAVAQQQTRTTCYDAGGHCHVGRKVAFFWQPGSQQD